MNDIRLNIKLLKTLSSVLLMPASDMIEKTTISSSTWYYILSKPDTITIQHLLSVANGLHIPVRRLFSHGSTDIVGSRDDYTTDPYLPCRYDGSKLQRIVKTRSDATWQKASKVSGITPTNLRNSILGESRTPVTRFLTVCAAFDIDPFTILIDENPEHTKGKRSFPSNPAARKTNTSLRTDIADLSRKMDSLNEAIAELKAKYEDLLVAHENLEKRVRKNSVNIEHINNDGYISIAAAAENQPPEYGK